MHIELASVVLSNAKRTLLLLHLIDSILFTGSAGIIIAHGMLSIDSYRHCQTCSFLTLMVAQFYFQKSKNEVQYMNRLSKIC